MRNGRGGGLSRVDPAGHAGRDRRMNVAKLPSMPTTTPSMAITPILMACDSGESLCPKQTGQASARRGTAE